MKKTEREVYKIAKFYIEVFFYISVHGLGDEKEKHLSVFLKSSIYLAFISRFLIPDEAKGKPSRESLI